MPVVRRPSAWRLLVSAIVVCLLAAGASSATASARRAAAPRVASQDAIGTAEAVAADHWGTAACSGDVEIAWRARPRHVNAVASWSNRTSPYGEPQGNYRCRVEFNPRASWTWAKFCTVLVHEFGHLTGHRHSPDPRHHGPAARRPAAGLRATRAGAPVAVPERLRPRTRCPAGDPGGTPAAARSAASARSAPPAGRRGRRRPGQRAAEALGESLPIAKAEAEAALAGGGAAPAGSARRSPRARAAGRPGRRRDTASVADVPW